MDEIKTRLESVPLWEILSLFESVLDAQVNNSNGYEAVVDDHKHITVEAKAAAILALLKA